jgi:Putative adhesin
VKPIHRTPAQRLAIGVGVLAVLAFIGAGAVSVAAGIVTQSKDTTHVVTGAISTVHIDVDGDISVGTGPVGQITVATHRVWSFHEPTVTERRTATGLSISAVCQGVDWGTCSTSVRLVVPVNAALTLTSSDGSISVDGVRGRLNLQSDNGDVDVASTPGPLQLSSDNGSVTGTGLTSGQVQASSDNGDVTLGFVAAPETASASSENGSVTVLLPRGPASYLVSASTDNGSRSVGVPIDSASNRHIVATSEDGDVTVAYQPG